jgi:hypothetical protein
MTQATLKMKDGAIMLPKKFQKAWKNAEIFARISDDTVVLKKIQKSSFWDTWKQMKSAHKDISEADIDNAISWARKGKTV